MARASIAAQGHLGPDGTLPDISIYPEGENQAMPSFAHERAMHLITDVLISVLAPESLVGTELAVLTTPSNFRTHLVPDLLVALGVGELDPVYLFQPGLRVYHLQGGTYHVATPDPSGGIPSVVLPEYEWIQIDRWLRLRERATGLVVPTPRESLAEEASRTAAAELALDVAKTVSDWEAARATAAEAELSRVRALLARLQSDSPDQSIPEEHGEI